MKQLLAWTIRTTLRPALSPKTPLRLQRFCSDAASAIVLGPRGYQTKKPLYTTNFTEPLSYQDSAFLKLPKFP
ncbi:hypothetical protein APD00_15290 [Acinetobacter baumannii]|nr:hypothetical protein APD00_15290 [Acinetobacter baumannii]